MDKKIIESLKEKLIEKKEEVEKILSSMAKKTKGAGNDWEAKFPPFGEETASQEENIEEVEEYLNILPIEQRLEKELLDIKEALKKIKGKKYGICERCKKNIEEKRLKIIPYTKYCLKCAEKQVSS